MGSFPTYAYEDNKVTALDGKHVIASGTEFAKVAETAEEYFNALRHNREVTARSEATHIVTPNGERGTILGRTASIWSDQITVRFDNGQIRHYDTFAADGLRYVTAAEDAPKNPMEYFQSKLDEAIDPTRQGLTARLNDLDEIRKDASTIITAGTSHSDTQKLHQIVLTAEAEKREIKEALAHLEAADEAIEAPHMAYAAVEQASMGRGASDNWLEVVAQEMIAESEAQDFDKLASEGPALFVSEQDDAVVAHAGITRDLASDFIIAKTAGFQGDAVTEYREQFMAQVEVARQREASYRRQVAKTAAVQKEASIADALDDALFL